VADTVVRDDRSERFELTLPEGTAELMFRRLDDRLVVVHTEVPHALSGGGVGGALVRAAVDYAVAEGLTVVPRCPFAREWLRRHPDVAGAARIDWS
jgi:uncharacterized protein